jgi:hypothetical protein
MNRAVIMFAMAACLVSPVFAQDRAAAPAASAPETRRTLLPFYPAYERALGNDFWMRTYRLTPREYKRLRSAGFGQQEVYLIANAARATGLGTQPFADAVHRGLRGRGIAAQFHKYHIKKSSLTYVMKEWRTPEWAAAVGEDVFDRERLSNYY